MEITVDHDTAIRTRAVERYFLQEMNDAEAEAFEAHYFDCRSCAQDVGETDTILLRRETATEGGDGTATIDVEIVALSLVSTAPVELCGGPSQQISLTLDAARTTALPNTGFGDDVGLTGMFALASALVLVIVFARRLRTANL